jgi:hypothetical protein
MILLCEETLVWKKFPEKCWGVLVEGQSTLFKVMID